MIVFQVFQLYRGENTSSFQGIIDRGTIYGLVVKVLEWSLNKHGFDPRPGHRWVFPSDYRISRESSADHVLAFKTVVAPEGEPGDRTGC